jgi:hypothetical protein
LGRTAPTNYHRIVRKSQYNGVVRGRLLCSPPPPPPPSSRRPVHEYLKGGPTFAINRCG